MPTVHLVIRGKVQGVFYRASAREMAMTIGVSGWVRNTEEGHVEAVACGNEEQVAAFIEWCRKGPDKAIVTAIDIQHSDDRMSGGFRILR